MTQQRPLVTPQEIAKLVSNPSKGKVAVLFFVDSHALGTANSPPTPRPPPVNDSDSDEEIIVHRRRQKRPPAVAPPKPKAKPKRPAFLKERKATMEEKRREIRERQDREYQARMAKTRQARQAKKTPEQIERETRQELSELDKIFSIVTNNSINNSPPAVMSTLNKKVMTKKPPVDKDATTVCDCGKEYKNINKSRHLKSKWHKDWEAR